MAVTTNSAVLVLAREATNPHHAAVLAKLHDPAVMKALCDSLVPQGAEFAPGTRPGTYKP